MARFYRSDAGKNAPVSTEITGYAVSALLFLHQRTGQAEYLEAALRGARFLTRTAWDAELQTFPFELSKNGDRSRAPAYFFDSGIIVRGLLGVWRITKEREFLETAVAAGRAMMMDFRGNDVIHPILALPSKRPLAHEPRWSASPGCYQLKAAMAWQELFEATREMEFFRAYESTVASALENEYHFLPGDTERERVMDRLHAYAYFLEGLSPLLQRPDCAHAFRDGIDRIAAYLREISPLFVRSDVYAQLLRIRLLGDASGVVPLDQMAAAQEAGQAAGFQLSSADPRIDGGFCFGRKCGEALPFVNPVSTAFCIQALAWWADRRNNTLEARRQFLI